MELCTRSGSIRDRCFHRAAGRSRHPGKAPLMCCAASFVIVMSAVMKTYELNVSCTLADSERWPGFDADAPSGLLLPSAHPSAARPLSAHCARPAAAVYGRIPLKTSSLYTRRERRGAKNGDTELTQAINMFYIVTCNNLYLHTDIAL